MTRREVLLSFVHRGMIVDRYHYASADDADAYRMTRAQHAREAALARAEAADAVTLHDNGDGSWAELTDAGRAALERIRREDPFAKPKGPEIRGRVITPTIQPPPRGARRR